MTTNLADRSRSKKKFACIYLQRAPCRRRLSSLPTLEFLLTLTFEFQSLSLSPVRVSVRRRLSLWLWLCFWSNYVAGALMIVSMEMRCHQATKFHTLRIRHVRRDEFKAGRCKARQGWEQKPGQDPCN